MNERVTNPYQRRNSLMNFERQEIYFAMSKGKVEDALRLIGSIKNAKERASFLMQIALKSVPDKSGRTR